MEVWKDIKGYEGHYQVSDMGNVRSLKRNKNLKPSPSNHGYLLVDLYKDGKRKMCKVHRLVAQTFIPNPENKPTVDHINTIKTDNRVSNLRWFTRKEQMMDNEITRERNVKATSDTVIKAVEAKKKKVLCITTGEVFNSAADAARHYNMKSVCGVSNAANPNNNRKSAGKLPDGTPLEWKYID